MSDKLDKLRQERDKEERQLRKATNDEKALAHEIASLTRAERMHLDGKEMSFQLADSAQYKIYN